MKILDLRLIGAGSPFRRITYKSLGKADRAEQKHRGAPFVMVQGQSWHRIIFPGFSERGTRA